MEIDATLWRRLASGSALRMLNYMSNMVVAFFLTPFIVASLGDRMYGLWTVIAGVVGYYGLLDLGLAAAVTRHVAGAMGVGDHQTSNRIYNTSLALYALISVGVLLITAAVAWAAPMFWQAPEDIRIFRLVIGMIGIDAAIGMPARVFAGVLSSEMHFDLLSLLQFVTLVVRTVLIVLILFLGYGIVALALVTVLSHLPMHLGMLLMTRWKMPFLVFSIASCSRATLKKLFSFSVYVFVGKIADQLRFHIDYLVITAFLSLAAVTHYKIAALLVFYFTALTHAGMGVLSPVFSQLEVGGDHARMQRVFLLGTRLSMIFTTFIAFGLVMWGKPFINRWMGASYLDAYIPLVLLASGALIMHWQVVSVHYLVGVSRHRVLAFINLAEGLLNLLLSVILIQYYGLIGVAMGTFIPTILTKVFIQPVYVARCLPMAYWIYVSHICRTAAGLAGALLVPMLITVQFAAPRYDMLVIVGSTSLLTYGVGAWFLALEKTERRWLYGVMLPIIGAARALVQSGGNRSGT